MNCPLISKEREVFLDYCAGRLDARRAAESERHTEFERHIAHCDACTRIVAAQREVWETLDHWGHADLPEVSANFDARLYARIAHERTAPGWRRWLRGIMPAAPRAIWKPAISMAVACAVLAIGLRTAGWMDLTTVRTPRPVQNTAQMESAHAVDTHADIRADTHVDIEQVANALDELDLLMPVSRGTPGSQGAPTPKPSPRVM
jgi:hypothetical protein